MVEECSVTSIEDDILLEESITNELQVTKEPHMSPSLRAEVERKRQKALLLKQARMQTHPYKNVETISDKVVHIQGSKYIDTGGGFLIEEEQAEEQTKKPTIKEDLGPIIKSDRPLCLECNREITDSFLFKTFDYPVCDDCRDNEDKHALITRTDAKQEYLLKDCDFDRREPPLKFLSRKNPHNVRWGSMKLYLQLQIEKRALEVWGSEENLLAEKEKKEEKKHKTKMKKFNKQVKALRMSVRSSLYDKTSAAAHTHEFAEDIYNESDDSYSHTCKTCGYEETFEKM